MAADDDELSQYRAKRDPGATNEPFASTQPTSGETWGGDFVVHLHDATRRHHDLRLQVGSVLKSLPSPVVRVSTRARNAWPFRPKITRSPTSTSKT